MHRGYPTGASAIGGWKWLGSSRAPAVLLGAALIAGTVLVGTAGGARAVASAPAIYAISPNTGPTQGGTGVTIYGSGFTGATQVKFGSSTTNCGGGFGFFVASDSQIFVSSPSNAAGTVDVVVVGPGGSSPVGPADKFTYTNPSVPIINGISPNSGTTSGGTSVTIFGSGFSTVSGVMFGSTPIRAFPSGDTTLFVTSPAGAAGTVDITVINSAGSSATTNADRFTFVAPGGPVVQAVAPNHGTAAGGTQVVIVGTGFTNATAVHFGTTSVMAGSFNVLDDSHMFAFVPAGTAATTVDVTVTTPSGTSLAGNADRFSYIAPGVPVINGVVVNHGPTIGGTQVELIGSGFTGATTVMFGTQAAAAVNAPIDSFLLATSPAESAGTVDITVTTPAGTSSIAPADKFTYQILSTPVIYGISPHSGITSGRTFVSIFGSGLVAGSTVHFGGNTGTNVYAKDNYLGVESPAGTAGTVDITVTNPAGTSVASNTDKFTYVPPGIPAVNAVNPNQGLAGGGTNVTLFGTGFTGATAVHFGSTSAGAVFAFSDTQLGVSSPAGTSGTTVDITVTTPVGTSAISRADQFTYVTAVAPSVTAVSPSSGPASGGTSVWLTGTGFSGAYLVNFGTSPAGFVGRGDNVLEVMGSPAGTNGTTVDITVATPGGTSAVTTADRFTYTAPVVPAITAVSPSSGSASGNTTVYISGTGLSGATAVSFGTTAAMGYYVHPDGTVITATSPAGTASTTVDVRVVGPGGTSPITANDQFTYTAGGPPPTPTVSAVSPNSGPPGGGTTVYISGSNFGGATQVSFGGSLATFFTIGINLIHATSPSGPAGTAVDVTVTTSGGTSATTSADKFTYGAAIAPNITGISPTTGPAAGGTTVFIEGSNFGGVTAVTFGTASATGIFVLGDNLLSAVSPAQGTNPSTVHVTVTTPAGTSATSPSDQFLYGGPAPSGLQVNGVTPKTGSTAGGTGVDIYGMGFGGATGVKFGGVPAQNLFVWSDTHITATSPAGSLGSVDITVTVGGSTSATGSADNFTYVAPARPAVNGIQPNSGSQFGGTFVTIYGSGFSGATAVHFGTAITTNFFVGSDTQMSATAPAGTGSVDVTVTGPAGTSATSNADAFTYVPPGPPIINAVDPASGTSFGGTSVVLFGSGLTGATAVAFGGRAAGSFFPAGDNQLFVTSPAGTAGTTVDITVTTPAGTSATSNADRFNFVVPPVPAVNAVSPNRGGTNGGNHIALFGSGFSGATAVHFGTQLATNIFSFSDDTLNVTSPPGVLGTVDVTVTAPGGVSATSGADKFTYYVAPAPTITAVSPNTGPAGTLVYLTGTGLGDVTGVLFGSTCVPFFGFGFSDTILSIKAPAGPVGTVDVTVVSPDGTSAITVNDQFTYTAQPVPSVTAVAPAAGPSAGGTTVFITGTGLSGVTGVTFGSATALHPYPFDDGLIEVGSPTGASGTTVDVQVTTPGGTSAATTADRFTWGPTPTPTVSVVSPNSGPSGGGSDALVTGSGLQSVTQMQFGSTTLNPCFVFGRGTPAPIGASPTVQPGASQPAPIGATPTVQHASSLPTVRVPVMTRLPIHQHASGTGRTAVTSPTFATILSPSAPMILTNSVGPASSTQTPSLGFGGPQCPSGFRVFSDNLIDVITPPQGTNPSTVDITATSAGGTSATSAADQFTYTPTPAPAVSAVSPSSGRSAGGSTVFISGSNLRNPSSVKFGTAQATIAGSGLFFFFFFNLNSDSLIVVTAPPGTNPSTVDVTVTTAGGTSATSSADQYTYGSTPVPTVGVVSPGSGPIGSAVFITGTGFYGATAVNFGGTPAIPSRVAARPSVTGATGSAGFFVISDTLIVAVSPTHAIGTVDITVVTTGGTSATSSNDQYTYTPSPTPVVSAVGPNTGPPGTTVYITGTGLTAASAVSFGGTSATSFFILSDTLIRATSPAGSGTVDITVTTPGGTSATSASDQWTFQTPPPVPTVTSVVPSSGPAAGGTSVTITGTNLSGATAVNFGAAAASSFAVSSATAITATSPAGNGTVDVTVTTPGGITAISASDKFTYGTPTAPTGLGAVAGDGEATLTWTPPSAGAPVTSYTVVASPGGATTTVSSLIPAATLTGLTNGTAYTFTVAATNSVGTGPTSTASSAVTPTAVVQGPSVAVLPAMSNYGYGGYLTTAYLKNLGGSAAHIRVQYFDTSGHGVGSGNSAAGLAPGATWTLRTDNGNSLAASTPGSAVVYSDQALAVFVNEFAPGNTSDASSYTGISVATGTGNTIYAPAISSGAYGGYYTGIGLLNMATSTANITLTYRDGSGTVIKTQTLNSVPAGAYLSLYSGNSGQPTDANLPANFAGTATITSSAGNLAAVVNETGPGKQFSSYDAAPTGSTTLYAPAALRNAYGGYNTGMGIQNTTGTAGTVTITYYDSSGTPTVKSFPIVANGYLGVYQGTDIPVDGPYTAKVTSTVAIAAIVNEVAAFTDPSVQQSTSYNTFAAGSSSLNLPLVESGGADGWSTGDGIMNTGTAATTVTVTYFDTATGLQVGTPQSLSLQPNAFWGLYQPIGGLPVGMRASAVVTTSSGGQAAVICNEANATSFMSYIGQ